MPMYPHENLGQLAQLLDARLPETSSNWVTYDFASLSHSEFEELANALIGAELAVRFERFAEGPDQGIDGRYAESDRSVILQAKHYLRSGFSKLNSAMASERAKIDQLAPSRYLLATSCDLTPARKQTLAEKIGPSLQSPGDIFGPADLNALLRKFPDIEKAHPALWQGSTAALRSIVSDAVVEALGTKQDLPEIFSDLLGQSNAAKGEVEKASNFERNVLFLIKTHPADDEFALWLAPKLEAEGYTVFADILSLEPGDRWRREEGLVLQHRAAKALICVSAAATADTNVQDNIDLALEVAQAINDSRFIIPLRLEATNRIKGIGDARPVDFVRGWGEGLQTLLETLRRQKVPQRTDGVAINLNWELFRRRRSIELSTDPEPLTSNWLRVLEAPDTLRFFSAMGAQTEQTSAIAAKTLSYSAIAHRGGIVSMADLDDIEAELGSIGRFELTAELPIEEFAEHGWAELAIVRQVAQNMLVQMFGEAWISYCRERGLLQYNYSSSIGFHASPELAPIGKLIPWGRQGERRASMLRNIAKGHIWQFGVTATPVLWPFWHLRLKSRVLFAEDNGTPEGLQIDDAKKMHRLRRSICKGWRNKQWHGRLLAFLELLSGESAYIRLKLGGTRSLMLDASPILFTSPVSTVLPDLLDPDAEETDASTLGRPELSLEEDSA